MDFNTSLGVQVGSLTMSPSELALLLVQQKTLTTGSGDSPEISKLLPVPLPLEIIMATLFELDNSAEDWICLRDNKNMLKECHGKRHPLKIQWTNRHGVRRTIIFSQKSFDVQLDLMSYQPNVQIQDNIFVLQTPEGFRLRKLRSN